MQTFGEQKVAEYTEHLEEGQQQRRLQHPKDMERVESESWPRMLRKDVAKVVETVFVKM